MQKRALFVLVSVAAFAQLECHAAESNQFQLTIETNWPALPEEIVDFYIPPTRSRSVIAATRRHVFRAEEGQTNWVPIYTPAAPATILGVSGYAKASSALYVVHSSGIARTRDGGTSWSESVPPDYEPSADVFLGISVNPTNRREAALAFGKSAWITRDLGDSFSRLTLPEDDTLLGITYAGSDAGALVLLSERALYLSGNAGSTWVTQPHELLRRGALASSDQLPFVAVSGEQGLIVYDLNRPGFRVKHVVQNFACERLATDCGGRGLLWGVSGAELRLMGTRGEGLESLANHRFDEPLRQVREHPRTPDQAFCATAKQILLAGVAAATPTEALTNLWNPARFAAGPVQEISAGKPSGGGTQSEVQELLQRLAAAEPPLQTLLESALEHARFSERDINRWRKRARARNWLPEFRVGTGVREYPVDQSEIYAYVDRYGIPQRNDLRLTDDVQPMGYVGVTLVWDLSRLLYDPEETDINQEKRYEISQRNALLVQISTLYYERLELLVRTRLRAGKMGSEERLSNELKIRQKTDLLNSLCGKPLLRWQSAEVK